MRISRGLGMAIVASAALLAVPASADDTACVDAQCAVLTDNALTSNDAPRFVAEVPLPPDRLQASIVVRQQRLVPRVVVASARVFPVVASTNTIPVREISRPTAFWLTVGTGF